MSNKLEVGGKCANNHLLVTQYDIVREDRGYGQIRSTCRRCRNIRSAKYRDKYRDRVRKTVYVSRMLAAGKCSKEHAISSLNDLYAWGEGDTLRYRCKACMAEKTYLTALYVILECGDELYFKPPVPRVREVLYCPKCADYKIVRARRPAK